MSETKGKGRLMGVKFKTFSGAAKRASFERFIGDRKDFTFTIEAETDPWHIANGFRFRIRKTKRSQVAS